MEETIKKEFDGKKIVKETKVILPATIVQVFKNSALVTIGLMVLSFKGTDKLDVVRKLLLCYTVVFLARMVLEGIIIKLVAKEMEQNESNKYNRERARKVLGRLDKEKIGIFTLLHRYLKRDVGLMLLGAALIPILPMTYTLTRNIPMLHKMYPKESQLQISKRASVPEKQNEKLWSDAIRYLALQSSIFITLIIVKIMDKSVTMELLKSNVVAVVIGFIITALNALHYNKQLVERVRLGIIIDVKVDDIIEKEKTGTKLFDKFNATMKQMKEGFK